MFTVRGLNLQIFPYSAIIDDVSEYIIRLMEVLKTVGRSKKITRNYSCIEHISFWIKRIMLLYWSRVAQAV
jgi:hypothetical protein